MSRKFIVIAGVGLILILAGLPSIVAWLDYIGLITWARWMHVEYVTGTAATITIVMVVLLPSSKRRVLRRQLFKRECPVCEAPLDRPGRYCPTCGSRV